MTDLLLPALIGVVAAGLTRALDRWLGGGGYTDRFRASVSADVTLLVALPEDVRKSEAGEDMRERVERRLKAFAVRKSDDRTWWRKHSTRVVGTTLVVSAITLGALLVYSLVADNERLVQVTTAVTTFTAALAAFAAARYRDELSPEDEDGAADRQDK